MTAEETWVMRCLIAGLSRAVAATVAATMEAVLSEADTMPGIDPDEVAFYRTLVSLYRERAGDVLPPAA